MDRGDLAIAMVRRYENYFVLKTDAQGWQLGKFASSRTMDSLGKSWELTWS